MKPKRIVFVCPAAYPLFDKECQHLIGGMETRAALFAKALATIGEWEVLFAVKDFGQPARTKIDGVTLVRYTPLARQITDNVVPRFRKYKWRPVIHLDRRDLHFAWQLPAYIVMRLLPAIWVHRFWRTLNADIVCCFGNNPTSAETIAECYRHGIPSILFIASDDDLSADYHAAASGLNDYGTPRKMAWYAVTTADHVLVQTTHQRDLLQRNFGRSAEIIHNPIEISPAARAGWPKRDDRQYVLWIGRSDSFNKRPALVLELAKANPEIPFLMVVNTSDATVLREILQERSDNVTIIERVPYDDMPRIFRHAKVLINTSRHEGFPNTFLQAAVHGVPVVSLAVDPGGILTRCGCGYCAQNNFQDFGAKVAEFWHDPTLASTHADRFFAYACSAHSLESQTTILADFLNLVADRSVRQDGAFRWLPPFARFPRRR